MVLNLSLLAGFKRRAYRLVGYALLSPSYWMLHSVASCKAAWRLVLKPFTWKKTQHGLTSHAGRGRAGRRCRDRRRRPGAACRRRSRRHARAIPPPQEPDPWTLSSPGLMTASPSPSPPDLHPEDH